MAIPQVENKLETAPPPPPCPPHVQILYVALLLLNVSKPDCSVCSQLLLSRASPRAPAVSSVWNCSRSGCSQGSVLTRQRVEVLGSCNSAHGRSICDPSSPRQCCQADWSHTQNLLCCMCTPPQLRPSPRNQQLSIYSI